VAQAQILRSVPANSTSNDILTGQPIRFIRRAGPIQIGITGVLGTSGVVTAEVLVGGRSVVTGYDVPNESAVGAGPVADRDVKILARGNPGDEIIVNLMNASGGALAITTYVNVPNQ